MTDVAACLTMGLGAIGRPNNSGGGKQIRELLTFVKWRGPLIVIGEHDRKNHDTLSDMTREKHNPRCSCCPLCYPGKWGALQVAKQLAGLGAISVKFPPGKDTREWLKENMTPEPWRLGVEYLKALRGA